MTRIDVLALTGAGTGSGAVATAHGARTAEAGDAARFGAAMGVAETLSSETTPSADADAAADTDPDVAATGADDEAAGQAAPTRPTAGPTRPTAADRGVTLAAMQVIAAAANRPVDQPAPADRPAPAVPTLAETGVTGEAARGGAPAAALAAVRTATAGAAAPSIRPADTDPASLGAVPDRTTPELPTTASPTAVAAVAGERPVRGADGRHPDEQPAGDSVAAGSMMGLAALDARTVDGAAADPAFADPLITDPAASDTVVTDPTPADPGALDPVALDPGAPDPGGADPAGAGPVGDDGDAVSIDGTEVPAASPDPAADPAADVPDASVDVPDASVDAPDATPADPSPDTPGDGTGTPPGTTPDTRHTGRDVSAVLPQATGVPGSPGRGPEMRRGEPVANGLHPGADTTGTDAPRPTHLPLGLQRRMSLEVGGDGLGRIRLDAATDADGTVSLSLAAGDEHTRALLADRAHELIGDLRSSGVDVDRVEVTRTAPHAGAEHGRRDGQHRPTDQQALPDTAQDRSGRRSWTLGRGDTRRADRSLERGPLTASTTASSTTAVGAADERLDLFL